MRIKSRKDYIEECREMTKLFFAQNKALVSYVRGKPTPRLEKVGGTYVARLENGQPKGVVVAFLEYDRLTVGWAVCRANDKYNRHIGLAKAITSALPLCDIDPNAVPYVIRESFDEMVARANKYFRQLAENEQIGINV